jgi:CHAT domain-containing protein/tetratricopeptide (TPR) repeat protein
MNTEILKLRQLVDEAVTLQAQRRVSEAVAALESAAELARQDPVAKLMLLPNILQRLGPLLIDLGRYDAAHKAIDEALAAGEKLVGPNSPDAVDLRGALAGVHLSEGRSQDAYDALVPALAQQRQRFPVDREEVARTLNNLSAACVRLGRTEEGDAYIREAYDLLAARVDADDPLFGAVLHNMAVACVEAERLGPALYYFDRARASVLSAHGAPSLAYASVCHEMARLFGRMQRYPEAIELAQTALQTRADTVGTSNHPIVVEALRTMASLATASGDTTASVKYATAAYQAAVATYGQWGPETIFCIIDMLTAARVAGDKDEVEGDLRNVILPVVRKIGGADPVLLRCVTDLACLVEAKGDAAEARTLALEAVAASERLSGEQDVQLRQYFEDLAGVLLRLGEAAPGMRLLARAIRSDGWMIPQLLATRDDSQRAFYLRRIARGTSQFIRTVLDHDQVADPDVAAAAYSMVLNRKGLLAAAYMAQDDRRLRSEQPELGELLDRVDDLDRELAEVQMAGSSQGTTQLLASSDRLKTRLRWLNLEIEARTKPRRKDAAAWRPLESDAIVAALPAGTALVDVCAVLPQPPDDEAQRALERTGADQWLRPQQPARYVAFVLRRGAPVRMIDLGAGDDLERLGYSYLVVMNQGRADAVRRARVDDLRHDPEPDLSREVRQRFFDPLREAIGDSRAVLLAPDGVACQVPFAALVTEGSPERRLIDDVDISYLPDARAVLEFGRSREAAGTPVIVADPDFDFVKRFTPETPSGVDNEAYFFYFQRLPGTADEGWAVTRVLGGSLIRGAKAHEGALRACASPAVLHVASHGFYLRPFGQGIQVIGDLRSAASSKFGTFLRGHLMAYAENPFLRSGIALAGVNAWSANQPLPADVGDGLLSAAEVAHLDLERSELVVLSACSTALGDVHAGEGAAGLLQGLRLAGARTIVAALWQIPDEATALLMETFYRALLEDPRPSAANALKAAQSALRAAGKPPWQWAALVCYGELAPLAYRRPPS